MKNKSQTLGHIIALFQSNERVEQLHLDPQGIMGDKHYGKDQNRSLLITAKHSYDMAQEREIALQTGDLGENILVDFNPYSLKPGTQLQMGESIIEITQMSTLCKSLTALDSRLPKLLKHDRGIFAKVIKAGVINSTDPVIIINW